MLYLCNFMRPKTRDKIPKSIPSSVHYILVLNAFCLQFLYSITILSYIQIYYPPPLFLLLQIIKPLIFPQLLLHAFLLLFL